MSGSNAGNISQGYIYANVNGLTVSHTTVSDAGSGWYNSPSSISFIVPVNATYLVGTSYSYISNWVELD